MKCINEGKRMMRLGDDVDKTPATVTKYKSKSKSSYCIDLNQHQDSLSKSKIQQAISTIVEDSLKLKNQEEEKNQHRSVVENKVDLIGGA